jgi:hypothetical protein
MRKFLFLLTALSVFVSMCGCAGASDHGAAMTKEEINALIAKELPVGSPRSKVIQFLDERKIDNTAYAVSADPNSIGAMFRNVAGSNLIVKTSIHVQFFFKDDRLVSCSLSEKLTGP